MSVDQDNQLEVAKAHLALEKARTRRLKEAFIGAASGAPGVIATISYYLHADGRAFLAFLAFVSGGSTMIFSNILRKLNKDVSEKRKEFEELSGK